MNRSTPHPKSIRSRRRRIVIALLIYSIVGFFILPPIIRWQLVKRLPGLTHRNAAVQKVKVNPYALSLTIRGLSLTETNGEPFAAFDEFYANLQLSSLFRWAWTCREIKLTHPTARIVRDANGQFNFANLFTNDPPPATNQPKSLTAVIVQNLVVTNGSVTVIDQTRAKPFHTEYGSIDLELIDFNYAPQSQRALFIRGDHGRWRKVCMVGKDFSQSAAFRRHIHAARHSAEKIFALPRGVCAH